MILEAREVQNEVGEVVQNWKCLRTIWACIEPLTGAERLVVAQATGTVDTKITTRTSSARLITPKTRLQDQRKGTLYDVDANIEWQNRGVFSELLCKEAA